jgi:hypothetical protein
LTTDLAAKANLAGGNSFTGAQVVAGTDAASKSLLVKGASGQTAHVFELQRSDSTVLAAVDNNGNSVFGRLRLHNGTPVVDTNAVRLLVETYAAQVPIVARGAASQTANLTEWWNSAGTILARISSAGAVVASGVGVFGAQSNTPNAQLFVLNNTAANPGAVVKGAASQSANLQEWQNSAGTVLAVVQSNGRAIFDQVTSGRVQSTAGQLFIGEANGGGQITFGKQSSAAPNQGAGYARMYFRDGTNAGTLRLCVRAGAAGAETTIFDNIPQ